MSLTLDDIKERLKALDETTLLEVLEISSEDIIERFEDKILEKMAYFEEDLSEEEDDS